jgi:cytochrome c oxidase cbb3-type subunit I/II
MFYAIPMYFAGFTQHFMWKEFTEDGVLRYPNFLETVVQIIPMYKLRALGGFLYLTGAITMVYNLIKTANSGKLIANEAAEAAALEKVYVPHDGGHWHRWIERRPVQMLIISLIVILIGGMVELIPTFMIKSNIPTIASVKPYTPLELQGRDLYIREGCYTCHSQMIRPFRFETERYGEYSKPGEFVYDHPFQWGSKRTGPDLQREGGKYPNSWHYNHMEDPRTMSPGSIMPPYAFMIDNDLDTSSTAAKIRTMQKLGVPYPQGYDLQANTDLMNQANTISADLAKDGIKVMSNKEIVAIIAYLQRLGTDIKGEKIVEQK